MTDLNSIILFFHQLGDLIVNTAFFQSYGLFMLFLWSPFTISIIPIPIEIPIAALIYGHFNIWLVLFVTWVGIITGSVVYYFIVLLFKIGIKRTTIFEDIDESEFIHKHRWIMFALMPAIFILGDGLIAYAAAKHMRLSSFILPLTIGCFIRSVIAVMVSIGIISIPNFL